MEKIEKNSIFIQKANSKDRIIVFHDKIKRHLSDELLYWTDQKDDFENQVMLLKAEKEQKGKTLFPNLEKKDVRKYFSPLNLKEIAEDQKDEKQKQLLADIDRLQNKITQIDSKISEIKEFLIEIDDLMNDNIFDGDYNSDEAGNTVSFGLKKESD